MYIYLNSVYLSSLWILQQEHSPSLRNRVYVYMFSCVTRSIIYTYIYVYIHVNNSEIEVKEKDEPNAFQ